MGCRIPAADPRASRPLLTRSPPLRLSGRSRSFRLEARATRSDLQGTVADTWAHGCTVPGEPFQVEVGDGVEVVFRDELPPPGPAGMTMQPWNLSPSVDPSG
jgi:hypothetical protein